MKYSTWRDPYIIFMIMKLHEMINAFTIQCFEPQIEKLHKGMMTMDKPMISISHEEILGCFYFVTSMSMVQVLYDMQKALVKIDWENPSEKDWQNLCKRFLIFLQGCKVLKRELEDYTKKPLIKVDIEELIQEIKSKCLISDRPFCHGCNIF